MDITTIPRGAFLKYVYEKFDMDNPTEPDSAMRLEQWKRRHPTSTLNGASVTMGTSAATSAKTRCRAEYFGWIGKVKAISKAEGTANVFDPNYVPGKLQEQEDFEQDKTHIIALLHSCGDTPIIKGILQKHGDDGQMAVQKMMEKYKSTPATVREDSGAATQK